MSEGCRSFRTDLRTTRKVFTLSEAAELQRLFDNHAYTGEQLNWVNVKTGKSVIVGYS